MELLLNVLWLLLAVPAVWAWRREALSSGGLTRPRALRCLVILSCTLLLLFPVVSATDDLHAMRPEMEESSPSKRVIKPVAGAKVPAKLGGGVPFFSQLALSAIVCFNDEDCSTLVAASFLLPALAKATESAGRAPPASHLD